MAIILIAVSTVSLSRKASRKTRLTEEEISLIGTARDTMRVLTVDDAGDLATLRCHAEDFSVEDIRSAHFKRLAELMVSTMTSPGQDGVGIAGPQVGLKRNVVAVQRFDKEGEPVEVYPNIRIDEYIGEKTPGPEGCLSVPGLRGSVMRYREIVISYTDPEDLSSVTDTVKGFTAVIFQHETDHLRGILYTDKADRLDLPVGPDNWLAEDESGEMVMEAHGDTLDIVSPKGLTFWYERLFSGEYEISYRTCMPMDGCGHDRLSDMNCFWAATDPQHKDDISARAVERNGVFPRYNMLDLFYVGYGGNENTTTRFRRYYGSKYGQPDNTVKPLIKEYTDSAHLLIPGKWYSVRIAVTSDSTSFHIDGEKLFEAPLHGYAGDGHFALRLLDNHVRLTGLSVKQRHSRDEDIRPGKRN